MNKKLEKSIEDKKIAGVCGGLAEYFSLDSTLIRLLFAFSIVFWGTGLGIYIILALIMPKKTMDY